MQRIKRFLLLFSVFGFYCVSYSMDVSEYKNIKDYETLKKEYKKTLKEGLEKPVELLSGIQPELLQKVVLQNNFYKEIFYPLVDRLLIKKQIVSISSILQNLSLSEKDQEFVAQKLAASFYNLFIEIEGVEDQKFNLALALLKSELGNKILREWLELDATLPFLKGTYEAGNVYGESYTSKMNLMQKMLLEYAMREFEHDFGVPLNLAPYKDTAKKFVQAWKKGNDEDKEYVAIINHAPLQMGGYRPGMEKRYIESASLTTPELAKRIGLGDLFKDDISVQNKSFVDQFARACKDISLEA